jgi:drug/metabolite transporter (DMT)-like permease
VTYQNSLGILFFAPLFFVFEYNHFIHVPFNTEVLVPLLQLSVFASTFAFVFFTYAIRNIGVTKANIFANMIPVFTAFFAWLLLNESLGMLKMLGIGIVLIGLYLSQTSLNPSKMLIKSRKN